MWAVTWPYFQHCHPWRNIMPNGHFTWRLYLAPQGVIDEVRQELWHWELVWELVEVTDNTHDGMQGYYEEWQAKGNVAENL